MSANTKIFQIYFKPELLSHCDPDFEPLDNTSNQRPELREWYVWDQQHDRLINEDLDLWGFVSWKFREKTGLTGKQALDFIADNPGYDVYLFNPCIVNEACFINSWEQGDLHHPNISAIGRKFISRMGYGDMDLRTMVIARNNMIFANYVVGSREFWQKFMTFSRQLFVEAEKDPIFFKEVFGPGGSQYSHDPSLPNFTFLIERLIPTFISLEQISSIGYTHTPQTLPEKYRPYYNDIMALSNLKLAINEYSSQELYYIYDYYRRKFLEQNPGVINLE